MCLSTYNGDPVRAFFWVFHWASADSFENTHTYEYTHTYSPVTTRRTSRLFQDAREMFPLSVALRGCFLWGSSCCPLVFPMKKWTCPSQSMYRTLACHVCMLWKYQFHLFFFPPEAHRGNDAAIVRMVSIISRSGVSNSCGSEPDFFF